MRSSLSQSVVLALVVLICAAPATARYTQDQNMTVARMNGIDIAYTTTGNPEHPTVLLIMGLGASHRLWGEDFVNRIADAGFHVVLFDNRDTGQSAFLEELGEPMILWEFIKNWFGFDVDAPYTLSDMAADGMAVLDTLGVERAHIVGASMGGMIAQIIAVEHAARIRSLVSIMSTTGAPHLPQPSNDARTGLQNAADPDEDVAQRLSAMGFHPEAMPRQITAILAAGDRSDQVTTISAPTLVLHGEDDMLLKPPHGEHTAALIEGSKLIIYPGMGHNMPPEVVPKLASDMVTHMSAY